MQFGPVDTQLAEGAILAHSLPVEGGRYRKGMVLGPADVGHLLACGVARVTVARLGPDDLGEDVAAARLAACLVPDGCAGLARSAAFTGRVNIHATAPGLLGVDAGRVHRLNRIDPAITLATLPPLTRVEPGMLVGTVKIIAYGVEISAMERALAAAHGALTHHPVAHRRASLILTEVAGQPPALRDKGRRAVAARLAALGMGLSGVQVVAHDTAALTAALARADGDMVLILTGSATSDLHDCAPEAVRAVGGTVARFGMPVDPGNLLFLGTLGGRPLIGLPGCARSPALNGADFVLERLACGVTVSDDDIAEMGVGGLLKESPARPHPREVRPRGRAAPASPQGLESTG